MSWSISIPPVNQDDFEEAANNALESAANPLSVQQPFAPDEAKEQFDAGLKAAQSIIASGVLGEGKISGSISGHANPGHADTAGYSGDSVNVSLYNTKTPED